MPQTDPESPEPTPAVEGEEEGVGSEEEGTAVVPSPQTDTPHQGEGHNEPSDGSHTSHFDAPTRPRWRKLRAPPWC